MAYNKIKQDAKHNKHAKVLLEAIHYFADKNKDKIFKHGEITHQVLTNIADGLSGQYICKEDYVKHYELKLLSKTYLQDCKTVTKVDDDIPSLKI